MKTKSAVATLKTYLYLTAVLGLLLIPRTGLSASISCGQTVANTTTSASQVDQYTYSGTAGQHLVFALYGPLNCYSPYQSMSADIYNPSGQYLDTVTSGNCNTGATIGITLTNSGTYTILIHCTTYNATGSYSLSIQSITGGGCNSTPIACGQTVSASRSVNSEMDAYSYVGTSGQQLYFALYGPLNCYSPYQTTSADIYNPTGQYLGTVTSGSCNTGADIFMTLTNNGTYTILVHAAAYNAPGSYSLSIQSRTGGGCNGTPIACGETVSTNTSYNSQMDTYSYAGTAGQHLVFALYGPLNCYSPYQSISASIYSPSGQYLDTVTSGNCNTGASITMTLTNTGTYTILVYCTSFNDHGNYSLSIQSITGGGCISTPIACGQTVGNSTSANTEMDAYQLLAAAGEHMILSDSGSSGLIVDIYDPTGTNVVRVSIPTAANYTFPDTGIYTVLVHSGNYNSVGSYSLTLTVLGGCAQEFVDLAVVTTNQGGCLPLELVDSSPVAWVSFTVQAPPGIFSGATIDAGSQFTNATITPGTNSQWFVTMQASSTNAVTGDQIIGQICFNSESTQSIFVPIVLSSLVVTNQGGSIPGPILQGGTAVVIANQSLLEAGLTTNGQRMFTLYGKPTTPYEIDYSTNLGAKSSWSALSTNTLPANSIYMSLIQGTLSNAPVLFIRGLQQ